MTGQSEETVAAVMRRPYYMDATKAKEFGVIDKVSYHQHTFPCISFIITWSFKKSTIELRYFGADKKR